jgi:hypothetical protein
MKFGRILGLSLATLLIAVPAVHAQDDMGDMVTKKPRKQTVEEENNDPSRSGPMLGLGATYALDNFDGIGQSNDGSGGFNAHVGYRFNKWVAADLQIEKFQKFDGHQGGVDVGEVNAWAIGMNAKAYLLHGRYQPFLLAGLNYFDVETFNNINLISPKKTDDGPALRFGGGLDIYATNKFVVTADISYMLGLSQVEGYDLIAFSLGLLFRP